VEELRALVEATDELDAGSEERLRSERERISHVAELAQGAQEALEALAPEEGDGAAGLVAAAESALAPLERLAPELAACAEELRSAELDLRSSPTGWSSWRPSSTGSPRPRDVSVASISPN
jgi:DNA repair ATPase RecN